MQAELSGVPGCTSLSEQTRLSTPTIPRAIETKAFVLGQLTSRAFSFVMSTPSDCGCPQCSTLFKVMLVSSNQEVSASYGRDQTTQSYLALRYERANLLNQAHKAHAGQASFIFLKRCVKRELSGEVPDKPEDVMQDFHRETG